jgi:two-component system chemotaxis response regulator CheB
MQQHCRKSLRWITPISATELVYAMVRDSQMFEVAYSDTRAPDAGDHSTGDLLVVIGLSAGGLDPLFTLLSALPHDFNFPVVVVVHLHTDYKSVLAELLAHRTGLHVQAAADGKLARGVIYIAPPGQHVTMQSGEVKLVRTPPIHHVRPSIDVLFESAAHDDTLRVVAVLLSGAGSDGAVGISAIRAVGGVTIAQSPETALFRSMPNAAIATGCVDFVLPMSKIGEVLENLTA